MSKVSFTRKSTFLAMSILALVIAINPSARADDCRTAPNEATVGPFTQSVSPESYTGARIGACIYVQPWTPQNPSENHILLPPALAHPSLISDKIYDRWGDIRDALDAKITTDTLYGSKLADGLFYMYALANFGDTNDYVLIPGPGGTATLQFTVSSNKIRLVVNDHKPTQPPVPANGTPAEKYQALKAITGDVIAQVDGKDDYPRFDVAFDVIIQITLQLTPNSDQPVTATAVHARVRNANVEPENDTAKVASLFNEILNFFTGIDFQDKLQKWMDSKDLANGSVLDSVNAGLTQFNTAFVSAKAQLGVPVVTSMWTDRNRITADFAPAPIVPPPTDGTMKGTITWDPKVFPTTNCASFNVSAQVQVGPEPLLTSDGENYGVAPKMNVGRFSDQPAWNAGYLHGSSGQCNYTLGAVPRRWPMQISASADVAPAKSVGVDNPYVGNAHTASVMEPVGWDGYTATPDATSKDYTLISSLTAGQPIGNPHPVMPGERNEGHNPGIPVDRVSPGQSQVGQRGPGTVSPPSAGQGSVVTLPPAGPRNGPPQTPPASNASQQPNDGRPPMHPQLNPLEQRQPAMPSQTTMPQNQKTNIIGGRVRPDILNVPVQNNKEAPNQIR